MLPRVLEPEVMETEAEAGEYDVMDHSQVNLAFVRDLLAELPRDSAEIERRVFDAGTGTALIPIALLRAGLKARIVAADASEEMLQLARRNIEKAGYSSQIAAVVRDCKQLPEGDASFSIVMSNSLVHHIPKPLELFRECWRVLQPGGLLFLRDLCRPGDAGEVEHLVRLYAGHQSSLQQQLLRQSLHAALTVDEVRRLLEDAGLPRDAVSMTSDRHWTVVAVKRVAAIE